MTTVAPAPRVVTTPPGTAAKRIKVEIWSTGTTPVDLTISNSSQQDVRITAMTPPWAGEFDLPPQTAFLRISADGFEPGGAPDPTLACRVSLDGVAVVEEQGTSYVSCSVFLRSQYPS